MKRHPYSTALRWTGNTGVGTRNYQSYRRDHEISVAGKPSLLGSSDPKFRGDAARYSPEDLLVASLSACHMLWYLHLCAVNGVVVLEYRDDARGELVENSDGSGEFSTVTLHPTVVIAPGSDAAKAEHLHHEAHAFCFIARSVSFDVTVQPTIETS